MITIKGVFLFLFLSYVTLIFTNCKKQETHNSTQEKKLISSIKKNPWSMVPSMLSTYPYNTYSYFNFYSRASPFKCGGNDLDSFLPGKKCKTIYTQALNSKYKRIFTDL
jgi:hypothetical protein